MAPRLRRNRHASVTRPRRRGVPARPDREPRRGRGPDHPRLPGARRRGGRRLLERRPRLPPRPLADHAVQIGPPPAAHSYLNIPSLVAAATTTGCDAVHPGWGFLAENAEFARACEDNDLVFVGPRPETIETMGDKVQAKAAMRAAGLPLVPGSDGEATVSEAKALAGDVGFPLLLKASAGGGGKGMRLVISAEDLETSFRTAAAEAEANFGTAVCTWSGRSSDARHVEIQVLGDGEGGVLTLGERDCSIQRRHQKLDRGGTLAGRLARACARRWKTLPAERARLFATAARARSSSSSRATAFFFIEMNTRLQVEHPVTEVLTGVDLAREQLRVAAGEGLRATGRAELRGHALEFRINAEDPSRDFMPSPGTSRAFARPSGRGCASTRTSSRAT